ncbi:MAG: fructosamine kinase family protein [Methyloceanibacter sp.]|uniref:fructosamine kinase family protein n=1 Tax=Methyloceanibacter sp. TaxID=1965321 RepID=UPI003EE01DFB
MVTPPLKDRLQSALGSAVVESQPMSVGFGLTGLIVRLEDGRRLAVKARTQPQNTGAHAGPSLELEGFMLSELKRLSDLPVPQVHVAAPDLLVMDFIDNDGGPITPAVERDAARLLSALHATPRSSFGYGRDTLIGPLPQPNPESARWIPFFRDHRLMHMAQAAHDEARLPAHLFGRVERLAARLDDYLSEPPFPSLLHGDLWTGNVLVRGDAIAGFVDPAIYFGHPEIELAFTTMFGTFGPAFFAAYEELSPIAPGFHDLRRDLYNLYPALVHVRLFGASYLGGIEGTLKRLGL